MFTPRNHSPEEWGPPFPWAEAQGLMTSDHGAPASTDPLLDRERCLDCIDQARLPWLESHGRHFLKDRDAETLRRVAALARRTSARRSFYDTHIKGHHAKT
jgi:hypothetical protein